MINQRKINPASVRSLWILPLVVITEEKAGERPSSMRPQLVKTPGGHRQVQENRSILEILQHESPKNTEQGGGSCHRPWFILTRFYVHLPELDVAVMAGCGEHSAVRRQGAFTDSLQRWKHKNNQK